MMQRPVSDSTWQQQLAQHYAVSPADIERLWQDYWDRLCAQARLDTYLPLLVQKHVHAELRAQQRLHNEPVLESAPPSTAPSTSNASNTEYSRDSVTNYSCVPPVQAATNHHALSVH